MTITTDSMKRFDRYMLAGALATLLAAGSCTTVDDSLGSNLVPENQQMQAGWTTLPRRDEAGKLLQTNYVRTRLFQSDSIISSNLGYGYMGSELNDTTGLRTAGFLTQYLDYIDDFEPGMFGYRPFVDSARLLLSISEYGLDTLTPQRYGIYEITSSAYLDGKTDTTFYLNFDPTDYVSSEPLFEFEFPDGKTTGPATTAVKLDIKQAGERLINRLMLQEGEYAGKYSIYTGADSLEQWVGEFKGLYIRPTEPQSVKGKGTIYALDLASSGLAIYARNRVEEDPSLVKDTLTLRYIFKHPYSTTYGNVSVNTLRRDYDAGGLLRTSDVREPAEGQADTRPESDPRLIVEGMGGVVTEITFMEEFFAELEALIEAGNATGQEFTTLAFSQVRMQVYFTDSDYDWETLKPADPGRLITEMDAAPERIGLYTDYKKLTPITDYNYTYENSYDTQLAYGGKINRSRGCYTMDITGYVQTLWNSYAAERDAAKRENREIDLGNVKNRTIYAAPEAYGLYTPRFGILQGMPDESNGAPIRFEILYNLIR